VGVAVLVGVSVGTTAVFVGVGVLVGVLVAGWSTVNVVEPLSLPVLAVIVCAPATALAGTVMVTEETEQPGPNPPFVLLVGGHRPTDVLPTVVESKLIVTG